MKTRDKINEILDQNPGIHEEVLNFLMQRVSKQPSCQIVRQTSLAQRISQVTQFCKQETVWQHAKHIPEGIVVSHENQTRVSSEEILELPPAIAEHVRILVDEAYGRKKEDTCYIIFSRANLSNEFQYLWWVCIDGKLWFITMEHEKSSTIEIYPHINTI